MHVRRGFPNIRRSSLSSKFGEEKVLVERRELPDVLSSSFPMSFIFYLNIFAPPKHSKSASVVCGCVPSCLIPYNVMALCSIMPFKVRKYLFYVLVHTMRCERVCVFSVLCRFALAVSTITHLFNSNSIALALLFTA